MFIPMHSIITVNLNNAPGLRKTIESVVSQTFADYEYIIIDGGSTDGSQEVIKEFENRINYWISEPDNGIYNAMNKGILQAKGEYIQFLNSGDWLVDETILSKVFEEPRKADILYGNIYETLPNGMKKMRAPLTGDDLSLANFNSNTHPTIQHPATFIHNSLFKKGLYDENYEIIADIKFFVDKIIIQNCSVEYIPFPIACFNLDGISSNPINWAKTIEERARIFSELIPPRIFKDYELLFQIKDSPLLKYIPLLEKTDRLNRFVTFLVKLSLKAHNIFRRFLRIFT